VLCTLLCPFGWGLGGVGWESRITGGQLVSTSSHLAVVRYLHADSASLAFYGPLELSHITFVLPRRLPSHFPLLCALRVLRTLVCSAAVVPDCGISSTPRECASPLTALRSCQGHPGERCFLWVCRLLLLRECAFLDGSRPPSSLSPLSDRLRNYYSPLSYDSLALIATGSGTLDDLVLENLDVASQLVQISLNTTNVRSAPNARARSLCMSLCAHTLAYLTKAYPSAPQREPYQAYALTYRCSTQYRDW